MNLPTKEELEAEMERQRQEARERTKHSNSDAPMVALIISTPLLQNGRIFASASIVLPLDEIYDTLRKSQQILFIYITPHKSCTHRFAHYLPLR